MGLLTRIHDLLVQASRLQTKLITIEDEKEYELQDSVHLACVEKAGMISQDSKDYFCSLDEEAASVIRETDETEEENSIFSSEANRRQEALLSAQSRTDENAGRVEQAQTTRSRDSTTRNSTTEFR